MFDFKMKWIRFLDSELHNYFSNVIVTKVQGIVLFHIYIVIQCCCKYIKGQQIELKC